LGVAAPCGAGILPTSGGCSSNGEQKPNRNYSAKLCLNGHEYLRCQLTQRGIDFQALDNGLLACADIQAAQQISDGLSGQKIQAFFRKWLARLPHPYSPKDRKASYRYDLSVLQAEFSLRGATNFEQADGGQWCAPGSERTDSACSPA
jgi:hypothetical protein